MTEENKTHVNVKISKTVLWVILINLSIWFGLLAVMQLPDFRASLVTLMCVPISFFIMWIRWRFYWILTAIVMTLTTACLGLVLLGGLSEQVTTLLKQFINRF